MPDPTRRRGPPSCVLVLSAFPGRAPAERAARALVFDRHLACATVSGGATSYYRWEGRLHADPSVLLWGKTTRSRAAAAVRALRALHPDRVPEILVLPIRGGHAPYLAWVASEVAKRRGRP